MFQKLGQWLSVSAFHDLKWLCWLSFPPDKDNLFVPSAIHVELVYLRPSQPAVVPCRVTDAQARVSLHREVPPEEITANNTTLVTYDPTKGFVLQKPTEDYQGVFYCKAVTSGTPQISTKFQLLFVEGRDTSAATFFYVYFFLIVWDCKQRAKYVIL